MGVVVGTFFSMSQGKVERTTRHSPQQHIQVSLDNVEEVLQTSLDLYSKDRTTQAYLVWRDLKALLAQYDESEPSEELSVKIAAAKELIDNHIVTLNRMETEAISVFDLFDNVDSQEGWELARDSEGIRTYSRAVEGSNTYQTKITGIVRAPLFDLLPLIAEMDLYRLWIPFCTDSDVDVDMSYFRKIARVLLIPPSPISWVLSAREMLLYAYGVDMMQEDNTLVAMAKTPSPGDLEYVEKEYKWTPPPEGRSGSIRMDCRLAGMIIHRVNENTIRMSVFSDVEPKVQLPYWIVNLTTKKFAYLVIALLRKRAQNLDEEYKSRVAKGGIYDRIRTIIGEPTAETTPP